MSNRARELSRRKFLIGAGAVVGAGALAACTPQQSGGTPSPSTAASAAASAAPRRGGTLVAGDSAAPLGLDPHKVPQINSAWVYNCLYSPLCAFDSKFAVQPHIAESWDVSPDGKTYTFHIRSGVKFHNGRELTAEDARYSLERVRDPKIASPFATDLVMVDKITAPDPRTLTVTLKYPTAVFLKNVAHERAAVIVAKEVVDANGDLQNADGGSGPFTLGDIQPNNSYAVKRFDQYFESGIPYVDAVRWQILPEVATRQAALRTGQLDWAQFDRPSWLQLTEANIAKNSFPNGQVAVIHINYTHKPLDDVRVRQAMAMSIDRTQIIANAYGAGEISGPIPTGHPSGYALTKDELPAYYAKPNIDQAKKLLADAGYPNGFKTSIMVGTGPELALSTQTLQQQWKQIGIDLELIQYAPGPTLAADFGAGKWDMLQDLFAFSSDPSGYVRDRYFHSGNTVGTVARLKDDQLDGLMDKGIAQAEGPERRQTYVAAQNRILELAPLFFLCTLTYYEGISKRLQAYQPYFAYGAAPKLSFTKTWLSS